MITLHLFLLGYLSFFHWAPLAEMLGVLLTVWDVMVISPFECESIVFIVDNRSLHSFATSVEHELEWISLEGHFQLLWRVAWNLNLKVISVGFLFKISMIAVRSVERLLLGHLKFIILHLLSAVRASGVDLVGLQVVSEVQHLLLHLLLREIMLLLLHLIGLVSLVVHLLHRLLLSLLHLLKQGLD